MNAPATWSLGAAYPPHAITRNFNLITAFPEARPIAWNENPEWQHHVLVEVATRGWVSRYPNKKPLKFDAQHDTQGPAVIAVALQRNINDREQRIVVVGSGAFLANSFAGNGGNIDLGVNMVNWLASEDGLITIQPRAAKDINLMLSTAQLTTISFGALLGLPLLLAGMGGYLWWKRRR
jgi:LPXTG-motif cell wall-anchored protein